jgi:hypothetical protein
LWRRNCCESSRNWPSRQDNIAKNELSCRHLAADQDLPIRGVFVGCRQVTRWIKSADNNSQRTMDNGQQVTTNRSADIGLKATLPLTDIRLSSHVPP